MADEARYEALMDVVRHRMDIDTWIKTTRHKVMYRDESKVD
jgi:hypothetical protein